MKKYYLFWVFTSALFCACGSDRQTDFYENGEVRMEVEVDSKGIRNGLYREYYSNGTIKAEGHYKDDKMEGEYKEYYEDGTLSIDATFKADSIFGDYISYYPNKSKKKEIVHDPSTQIEKITEYYENGKVKILEAMRNGKQDGKVTSYYESGQIETIDNYNNGVQNGEYQNYFQNGKLKLQAEIDNGKTVFFMKYDSTGVLVDEYYEVKVVQSSTIYQVGETAHFDINITGFIGTNKYFRLLLTNDNIFSDYVEENQTFNLLKVGTIKNSSYVFDIEDLQTRKILSTGAIPSKTIIDMNNTTGKFSIDLNTKSRGVKILLGVIDIISTVDNYGVEKIAKSYNFIIKYEVK